MIVNPDQDLLRGEWHFWNDMANAWPDTEQDENTPLPHLFRKSVTVAQTGHQELGAMLKGKRTFNHGFVRAWQRNALIVTSCSHLVQILLKQSNFPPEELFTLTGIDVDFHPPDAQSGLLVQTPVLPLLGIAPPEQSHSSWHEHNTIFVKATSPAEPTTVMSAHMGEGFDWSGHTSLLPYMKTSAWLSRL